MLGIDMSQYLSFLTKLVLCYHGAIPRELAQVFDVLPSTIKLFILLGLFLVCSASLIPRQLDIEYKWVSICQQCRCLWPAK
jgi:hypothetical protein